MKRFRWTRHANRARARTSAVGRDAALRVTGVRRLLIIALRLVATGVIGRSAVYIAHRAPPTWCTSPRGPLSRPSWRTASLGRAARADTWLGPVLTCAPYRCRRRPMHFVTCGRVVFHALSLIGDRIARALETTFPTYLPKCMHTQCRISC